MANRSAKVEIDFGNDTHVFKLGYGQLKEIQDITDAGPLHILNSFFNGSYRIEYIREVIRCGLIGGGMSAADAIKKVKAYVENIDEYPLQTNVNIAITVLAAALHGAAEEEDSKKLEAAEEKA